MSDETRKILDQMIKENQKIMMAEVGFYFTYCFLLRQPVKLHTN